MGRLSPAHHLPSKGLGAKRSQNFTNFVDFYVNILKNMTAKPHKTAMNTGFCPLK